MRQIVILGEAEAQLAIDTIREALRSRHQTAVVAVADQHGELLALWRGDGAQYPSIQVATNKAYTAARLGEITGDTGRASREQGWDFAYYGEPRYVGWDGGVPVWVNGQVAGAVAVSGLAPSEDCELAQLAVDRILQRQETVAP